MFVSSWILRNCRFASRTSLAALYMDVGQDRGRDVAMLFGDDFKDTYSVKDRLKQIGFWWNGKAWLRDMSSLKGDSNARDILTGLGIQVDKVLGPPQAQEPPHGKPPMQDKPVQDKPVQDKPTQWILAENVGDPQSPPGTLYALTRSPGGGWDYVTEDGRKGRFKDDAEAKSAIKSLKDDGKLIMGPDPHELIGQHRVEKEEEQEAEAEQDKDVPGRIPRGRISEHQKAVEDAFLKTDDNVMLNALAGTGKTTMLRHLASYKDPGEKWLYLVFNKKNQVEASTGKGKFPDGVEVLTSHSFLGRVLGKSADIGAMPRTELWDKKGERLPRILDDVLEDDETFPKPLKYAAKKTIKQIASLAKANAVVPDDPGARGQLMDIIKRYQIDTDLSTEKHASDEDWGPKLVEKTLEALHYSLPGNGQGEYAKSRDHDDTLWYAATQAGVSWPRYDVVLADEVQDFNRCQTIMLQKLREAGARVVAVGDPNQALYLFRGADANAFDNVQGVVSEGERGGTTKSLPVNYRSGRKIIDYVNENTHVKDLRAGVSFEGEVTEGMEYDQAISKLSDEWRGSGKLADQTAFVARSNRPLVDAALDLLQNDVDFQIIGRDFSNELVQVVEKLTGKGAWAKHFSIGEFSSRMQDHVSEVEGKWKGKISKAAELSELKESADSLSNIVGHLARTDFNDRKLGMRVRDTKDFMEYLRRKFSGINTDTAEGADQYGKKDPSSFVTLTTAHRSKGLEFNRTYILEPNLFPHPRAKTPEELQQENNAWYVALTRAIRGLHVLAPKPDKRTSAWLMGTCRFGGATFGHVQ